MQKIAWECVIKGYQDSPTQDGSLQVARIFLSRGLPTLRLLIFAWLGCSTTNVLGCELLSLSAEIFIWFLIKVLKLREYSCLLLVNINSSDFFFPMPQKDLASPRHTVQTMVGESFRALNPRTITLLTPSLQQDRANVQQHVPSACPIPLNICHRFIHGGRTNVTLPSLPRAPCVTPCQATAPVSGRPHGAYSEGMR